MTYEAALTAIGDPTRRAILAMLRARPRPVGELAAALPVSQPAVSQHLKVLRAAGLVATERVGTRRINRLEPAGFEPLRRYLSAFWGEALEAYRASFDAPTSTEGRDES